MYVWIGCKLPKSFETEIRSLCLKQNEALGLDTAAFALPQHISLKISFEAPEYEAVLEELSAFLAAQRPFSLRIGGPEQNGNILWLPAEENETLRQLHRQLDNLLNARFRIPQHPGAHSRANHTGHQHLTNDPQALEHTCPILGRIVTEHSSKHCHSS